MTGSVYPKAFLIFIADIAALAAAFFFSGHLAVYFAKFSFSPFSDLGRVFAFILISLLALVLFLSEGHYSKRVPWWSQVRFVIMAFFCLMIVEGFLHFVLRYPFSRLLILLSVGSSAAFILFFRQIAHFIGRWLGIWNVPTAVIGNGDNAIDTLYALASDRYAGYDVNALLLYNNFADFDPSSLPAPLKEIEIIMGEEGCREYIKGGAKEFFMLAPEAMQSIDGEKLISLIVKLHEKHNYAIVPPTRGLALYGRRPEFLFGYDIMLFHPLERSKYTYRKTVKRATDIFLAAIALMLFSPLLIIIPALIKMEDGGPVFFAHKRIGYKGKSFYCLKFRTMVMDASKRLEVYLRRNPEARHEWEKEFKLKDDPRITKIGKILRNSSLDELPQFFNILAGSMSLVGPRPIIKEEEKYYGDKFRVYISMKPGITGLWQVSGRNNVTYKYRLYLDSWYVENWSIWHDIVILIKTVLVVLRRSGAY